MLKAAKQRLRLHLWFYLVFHTFDNRHHRPSFLHLFLNKKTRHQTMTSKIKYLQPHRLSFSFAGR